MEVIRRQVLTLTSYNRSQGDIHRAQFNIPNSLVGANGSPNERVYICPIQFCTLRNWYMVDEDNSFLNVINVTTSTTTVVSVPVGNYNIWVFFAALQTSFNAAFRSGWWIGWNPYTSRYSFSPPPDGNSYEFYFPNWLCAQCGFKKGATYALSYSSPLTSVTMSLLSHETLLCITSTLSIEPSANINNLNNFGEVMESGIVLSVPLARTGFGDEILWTNPSTDKYKTQLSNPVSSASFSFTDEFGKPIQLQSDWTLVFQIEFYAKLGIMRGVRKELKEIQDAAKVYLLNNVIDSNYQIISNEYDSDSEVDFS